MPREAKEQLLLPGTEIGFPPRAQAPPFLKYAGGKTWLIPFVATGIHRRLARTGGRYIEPFLGGGAIALDIGAPRMLLGDLCVPLIETWLAVVTRPDLVSDHIRILVNLGINEETYYYIRDEWKATRQEEIAARYIYLNRTSFNGLQRENRRGVFNVPYGHVDKYKACRAGAREAQKTGDVSLMFPSKDDLDVVAQALSRGRPGDVSIRHADFGQTVNDAEDGDVIYADPPYYKGFHQYVSKGFREDDQKALAEFLQAAVERGADVVSTNCDCPEIRELYSWAHCVPTAEARSINSDVKGRIRAGCLLITNDMALLGTDG